MLDTVLFGHWSILLPIARLALMVLQTPLFGRSISTDIAIVRKRVGFDVPSQLGHAFVPFVLAMIMRFGILFVIQALPTAFYVDFVFGRVRL